jgi:hypothetical protein
MNILRKTLVALPHVVGAALSAGRAVRRSARAAGAVHAPTQGGTSPKRDRAASTTLLALAALVALLFDHADAATQTWIAGTGNWDDPANWSGSAVPTFTDSILINNGGTAILPASVSATNQICSVGMSSTGMLKIDGGYLNLRFLYLGQTSGASVSGSVIVTSGTMVITHALHLSYGVTNITISGGSITTSAHDLGNYAGSVSTETVSGGVFSMGGVTVGRYGDGTLNLTDSGLATVGSGTGTVTLAAMPGSHGTLNLGAGQTAGILMAATVDTGSPYGLGTATVNFNHTGTHIFAPQLTGTMTVNKLASGTTFVTGSCSYVGDTNVSGGALIFAQDLTSARTISVSNGALLSGSGNIVNSGTMRVTGGAVLATSGTFTNNGLLDVMTAGAALPANFVNNGVVLDSSAVKVAGTQVSGSDVVVSITGYAGHGYQLQRCASLTGGTWEDVGAMQNGMGGVLTFTDTGGASTAQGFYRVVVSP